MSSVLFSPFELRSLTLNNRIAVSPMCQYAAENGAAVDWHLMHLGQFSMGAAGLVMTEATAVSADIVALARGMMFDPRWAWHAAEELGVETEYSKMYARCAPGQWPEVFPWRDK